MEMDYFPLSYDLMVPLMAVTFALSVFLYSLLWKHGGVIRKAPPEAGRAWPIIGHLHLLSSSTEPAHLLFGNLADKYGPIFTIKFGVKRAIVVSSSEIAKECFKTNDKVFASRPKSIAGEVLGYNYAFFPFSPYGDYFRQIRKIATLEVLSQSCIEKLKHIREFEVKASMKEMHRRWTVNKKSSGSTKVLVEMKEWLAFTNENVIFRTIVGKSFLEATDSKYSQGCYLGRKTFLEFLRLSGTFVISDSIPFLRWLDLGGHERAMKKIAKELEEVFKGWLEEHKHKRKISGRLMGDELDFMDVMLSILGNNEVTTSYDADTINVATSLTFLLGGAETTTATMSWALALLVNHPETLKKVQEELDENVGKDRQVKESDTDKLVYLQAVIKESMRLHPAAPLAIPHLSTDDCKVGDYHVPAGTRLLVNISKIHRDPNVWSEPNEFKPERFLTTHKGLDVKGRDFELLPFGSGRRMCPAISLALKVTEFTLASFLHGFEIETPTDDLIDLRETAGLTNHMSALFEVLLTPRLPAELY
ncbi:cytochrome P450 CYP82D47-like [Pyrus communis]|uniref:cytochrome P450 CYP82D47-like n=1 Tax=Pyrus communis TaxID=23211 RepID=UPI0035C01172